MTLLPRSPATELHRPGSEWHELVVRASLANPERWSGPPHGAPQRWDWGVTLATLFRCWRRRVHLERVARNLTPEQVDALWSDPSDEARELRKLVGR